MEDIYGTFNEMPRYDLISPGRGVKLHLEPTKQGLEPTTGSGGLALSTRGQVERARPAYHAPV